MEKQTVTCPVCKRQIALDPFGALNLKNEPVMIWHLNSPSTECPGSNRSVADVQKLSR